MLVRNLILLSWRSYNDNDLKRKSKRLERLSDFYSRMKISPPGFPQIRIDRIRSDGDYILIEGWATFNEISAYDDDSQLAEIKVYDRLDAHRSHPGSKGFSILAFPHTKVIYVNLVDGVGNRHTFPIYLQEIVSFISINDHSISNRALSYLRYSKYMTKFIVPSGQYILVRNERSKERLKELLGIKSVQAAPNKLLKVENFKGTSSGQVSSRLVTNDTTRKIHVIVPIYNAFEVVQTCLERLVVNTSIPYKLYLLEDMSTDERIRQWLLEFAGQHSDIAEIVLNDTNLGFIRNVNQGLQRAKASKAHAVILNSDAMVPEGWLERLMAPIFADDRVATTTPFSNDAEIVNVPFIVEKAELKAGAVDYIDSVAIGLSSEAKPTEMPTGVGFCMGMSSKYLAIVGLMDTKFGKGYGEEVDWCQRAIKKGGVNVIVNNLFVEHRGAKSFGGERKQALIEQNGKIISSRYADYDLRVQQFINSDPIQLDRFVLGLAYAQTLGNLRIYFAHNMGGGAESYLQNRLKGTASQFRADIVIRVGSEHRWDIELYIDEKSSKISVDEIEVMKRLFEPLYEYELVYSNLVGSKDPLEDLNFFYWLATKNQKSKGEVLFHDYFPLSPSYDLLNSNGNYLGVPANDETDPIHSFNGKSLNLWRREWQRVLELKSLEKIAFSKSSKEIISQAYPSIANEISVQPHSAPYVVRKIGNHRGNMKTVGVLGAIGYNKGAQIISDLSFFAKDQDPDFKIVVIGYMDSKYSVANNVHIHGQYRVQEIPTLVKKYDIGKWLMPSIWPETFSYATQEMIGTGLDVYGFDIGAQGETLRIAPNGHILPLGIEAKIIFERLNQVSKIKNSIIA